MLQPVLQPELNVTVPSHTWTPWSWTALDERMMGAIMVGAIMMGAHGVARHGVAIEEVKRLGLPEGRVGFCAVLELDGRRRLEPRSSQLRSPVNRERDLVLSLTVLVQYTVFKKVSEREESEH